MGKKKKPQKYNFLFRGKNIPTAEFRRDNNPVKGEPHTNIDFRSKTTGELHRRRKLGDDGYAQRDIDYEDKVNGPHAHSWHNDGKLRRDPAHQELTKKEKKEVKRSKHTRRFWQQ